MNRQMIYLLIGLFFLLIIAGAAFRLVRDPGPADFQATQEASLTDCADLYPAGSQAYKACVESQ